MKDTGFPAILRPSFTLGGSGGGIARSKDEFESKVAWALAQSPTHEVLIEESVLGWKEFELEVIRDKADNFIVVCSIENLDPMGVHTGDSITIAPAMTLTDREYQRLRDAARAVMTEIGVETGGSNVQFSVDPKTGDFHVIEMNPRVSRSSALASKATGYPIAKIAAKLAVGYTLDELQNDITRTSAAFEPVIDYVVVKWPRFAFEKFPGRRHDARHADEERGRGDEHRPHVLRGAAEGGALARDRQGRPRVAARQRGLPGPGRAQAPAGPVDGGARRRGAPRPAAAHAGGDAQGPREARRDSDAPTGSSTWWTRCASVSPTRSSTG